MASTNPTLYGAPRPKNKPIQLSSTSIHALSTELALARSRLDSSKAAPARPRPSKTSSLFTAHNKGVASRAARDDAAPRERKPGPATSEADLHRSRKKLKEKAKLYAEMKRGDADGGAEALVDFDRKWAEEGSGGEEDEEEEDEDGGEEEGEEMVEYEDEFGRTRWGKKSLVEREKERERRRLEMAGKEGGEASIRPAEPSHLIFGNTIQSHAFMTPTFTTVPTAEKIKASMPTEQEERKAMESHYDASKEVRTKGVGFYQFSTDPEARKEEMEALEAERKRTENAKKEREERKKRKREELEARREQIRNKRRGKVGEAWLTEFMGDLGGAGQEGE